MAKKKFLEDVKVNPARFYRLPSDVNRDRRLSDDERLEIFQAWEREARAAMVASEETMTPTEPTQLDQVIEARKDLQQRALTPGGSNKGFGVPTSESNNHG